VLPWAEKEREEIFPWRKTWDGGKVGGRMQVKTEMKRKKT
jgi:hypothetical protein